MSLEIMAARLDLLGRAERLAQQEPEALRREAVRAARDVDVDGLWALTEGFLVTRGARGARVSEHTLASYRQGVQVFLDWARGRGVSLLRPRANDGFAYARHLEGAGLAPSSVKVRLAAARALFGALRWADATQAAPFTDVRAVRDPVPAWEKRKPYPKGDLERLLARADAQQAVLLLLGAHCGLRVSEMLSLQRADLHLDHEQPYLVVTGKRQKRQEVPVSLSAARALRRWVKMTPMLTGRVLSLESRKGVAAQLRELCAAAGVRYDQRHVHGLRHTAGTEVYRETRDLLEVRDLLRHAGIETSQVYVNHARQGEKAVNRDW